MTAMEAMEAIIGDAAAQLLGALSPGSKIAPNKPPDQAAHQTVTSVAEPVAPRRHSLRNVPFTDALCRGGETI